MPPLETELVVSMAELLMHKQVESSAIEQALELLCHSFAFDRGAVYEIDQCNTFLLRERYGALTEQFPAQYDNAEFSAEQLKRMAEASVVFHHRGSCAPEPSKQLERLSAGFLTATSVVDELARVSGLIVFTNHDVREPLQPQEVHTLTVLLSMLGQYIRARMFQNKISFTRTSLHRILDNTGIDIYVNDFYTHEVLYVNKSMAAPYGGVEEFMRDKCWKVLFPGQTGPCEFCPQKYLVDDDGNPTKVYTWDYQRAFDGSWFRVFSTAFPWIDGRLAHVVSSADITDNKRNEALIQYMANYDQLTDLPNRRMLINDCEQRINQAAPGTVGYVLFFDIDGFKSINDEFGHDAGDDFLVQLGQFFSQVPMLKNAIYRNGGDEFVAVLDGVTEENIRSLAGFIRARFQKPWQLKKGSAHCGTSIGVACYPSDGTTAEVLLLKADQAMYHVKKEGGGGICFAHELHGYESRDVPMIQRSR